MSYILDALKKAERERGVSRVPTLMTVHDLRPMQKNRLWILAAALAVFAVSSLSLLLYTRNAALQKTDPLDPINRRSQANRQESSGPGDPPSARIGLSTKSVPEFLASPEPTVSDSSFAAAAPGPRIIPQSKPAIVSSDKLQRPHPGASAPPKHSPGPEAPETINDFRNDEAPDLSIPDPTVSGGGEITPVSTVKQTRQAPLGQAIARMNMSVLVYDEKKADRMIFVDGRKYIEGDYIEGLYFVESITPEGAVLTYEGERMLLRPRFP